MREREWNIMRLRDVVTRGPCWLMNGLELFPVNNVICGEALSALIFPLEQCEDPSLSNCHQASDVSDNTNTNSLTSRCEL